jgi:hypothetical protein
MLYRPSTASTATHRVSGQFLAKNRLNKRARARLAAEIIAGRTVVSDLTVKQVAALCGVSIPYIMEARQPDRAVARLLREWSTAGDGQRVAFACAAGVERMFDVVVQAAA